MSRGYKKWSGSQ